MSSVGVAARVSALFHVVVVVAAFHLILPRIPRPYPPAPIPMTSCAGIDFCKSYQVTVLAVITDLFGARTHSELLDKLFPHPR